MIHPYFLCGIVLWGHIYAKHFKKLKILQNKAVNILIGALWRDYVTPCYVKMNISKLNKIYIYEVAKLIHKHTRKKLSTNLTSFFYSVAAIYIPRCKTQKLQISFRYQRSRFRIRYSNV